MPEVKCDMCGDTIKLNLFEDHDCQVSIYILFCKYRTILELWKVYFQ